MELVKITSFHPLLPRLLLGRYHCTTLCLKKPAAAAAWNHMVGNKLREESLLLDKITLVS